MDAAIIVALIALAGTVGNVSLTYVLTARSQRRQELKQADATWFRYRSSLASAADELDSRIENILTRSFLDAYGLGPNEEEAIRSTLFRIAQYFGWVEILRQYMRNPDPRWAEDAKRVYGLQVSVAKTFNTDDYGAGAFMIWREAQRAIGELMITRDREVVDTMGVAGFVYELETFRPWMSRMEELMRTQEPPRWPAGERERLEDVRAALAKLVAAVAGGAATRSLP
jgi:hypothetical protein